MKEATVIYEFYLKFLILRAKSKYVKVKIGSGTPLRYYVVGNLSWWLTKNFCILLKTISLQEFSVQHFGVLMPVILMSNCFSLMQASTIYLGIQKGKRYRWWYLELVCSCFSWNWMLSLAIGAWTMWSVFLTFLTPSPFMVHFTK